MVATTTEGRKRTEAQARPAATRVVDAQRQAARTLRLTLAFLVAAAVTALLGVGSTPWLPLHLFLVGGVLNAIGGVTQLLAVTWSASPAPSDRVVAAQRWLVAAGTVAVAVGRELDGPAVTASGGTAVAAGLAVLAASLVRIRRTGRNKRFVPAIDGYLAGLACAGAGVTLGVWLASTDVTDVWLRARAAHVTLNLFGLVGLVIAATLPTFVATQARTRMSPRATTTAQRSVGAALLVAVVATAAGQAVGSGPVTAGGRIGYAVALVVSLALLPRIGMRQLRWAGPRLLQLASGMAWWIAVTAAMAIHDLEGSAAGSELLVVLAVGGVAQVLVASLAYLAPVLRAGGHEHLSAGFATTRSWVSLIAGNTTAGLLLCGANAIAAVAMAVWVADVVVRTARLGERSSPGPGACGSESS